MVAKIDRTGEISYNTFGSRIVIVEYRNANDIDVYFPQYDWTARNIQYSKFKKGNVACPYERRVYGVGYIGEGKYKAYENGKLTKCYQVWHSMLIRCYDEKQRYKNLTYKNCEVCDEWLCFQNFAEWYYKNYYEINNQIMQLDKDILHKGNKVYSPDNCIFVPKDINVLFTKSDNMRGNYPVGVHYSKKNKKFVAQCGIYDYKENKKRKKFLGNYETPEKAFESYKQFKEKHIKKVANYFKELIPKNYTMVCITTRLK